MLRVCVSQQPVIQRVVRHQVRIRRIQPLGDYVLEQGWSASLSPSLTASRIRARSPASER